MIYTAGELTLECEDYFSKTTNTSIESNGSYIMVREANYVGETNDSIDESIRFQPVDLREGYNTLNIRYAHNIAAFALSMDVYNTDSSLIANISLPSTGSLTVFATASMVLPSTLSGIRDLTFIFRDSGSNLSSLNVDYISFSSPVTHVINKSVITDFTLFTSGRPDIFGYQPAIKTVIDGNGDFIIENKIFYPKYNEYAIEVRNHATGSIIIRNCFFGGINGAAVDGLNPGNGMGILIYNSSNVSVSNNYFEYIQQYGIWCESTGSTVSNNLVIANNRFYSMQGQIYSEGYWGYQSKCVQFFNINGIENKIWYNRCLNRAGFSYMCDFINVYTSSGTSLANPVKIYYNAFLGGGELGTYNEYGAGIQIGDHMSTNDGGQYVYGKYNRLVFPGMVGMNIDGGYKMAMMHNYIYGKGQNRYTKVTDNSIYMGYYWTAMALYNYSAGPFRDSGHRVIGNHNYFEGYGLNGAFTNQTNPADTTIQNNFFNEQIWPLDILPYNFMEYNGTVSPSVGNPTMSLSPEKISAGSIVTAQYNQSEPPSSYQWYVFNSTDIVFENGLPVGISGNADTNGAKQTAYTPVYTTNESQNGKYLYVNALRSNGTVIQSSKLILIGSAKMKLTAMSIKAGQSITANYTELEPVSYFGWYTFPETDVIFSNNVATGILKWDNSICLPYYNNTITLPNDSGGRYLYFVANRTNHTTIQDSVIYYIAQPDGAPVDPLMKFNPIVPKEGQTVTANYGGSETPGYYGWYAFNASDIIFENNVPVSVRTGADWNTANITQYGSTITLPAGCNGKYLLSNACRTAGYVTLQTSHITLIGNFPVDFINYRITSDRNLAQLSPDTSVIEFISNISINADTIVNIRGKNDLVKSANEIVSTNDTIEIVRNGITIATDKALIYGDNDGDGFIQVSDLAAEKMHILNKTLLTGNYLKAGDITGNGLITVSDLLLIKKHILNIAAILQNPR